MVGLIQIMDDLFHYTPVGYNNPFPIHFVDALWHSLRSHDLPYIPGYPFDTDGLFITPNRRTASTFGYIQQFQPQRNRDTQW